MALLTDSCLRIVLISRDLCFELLVCLDHSPFARVHILLGLEDEERSMGLGAHQRGHSHGSGRQEKGKNSAIDFIWGTRFLSFYWVVV